MRRAGVLLHPTALPGSPVCGSFGAEAHRWLDLLADHGIKAWQLLPLAPPDSLGSPYSSPSSFALNAWLLDAELLVAEGLLEPADLSELPQGGDSARLDLVRADQRAEQLGAALLRRYPHWERAQRERFASWRDQQRTWLVDHCRFWVLRRRFNAQPWWQWPQPLACRQRSALRALDAEAQQPLLQEALVQWQLQEQWQLLLDHARERGIQVIGDVPFYVAHDSADVWSHRRLFSAAADGSLSQQSGVPPDYFSATGQLWGTPVYRWPLHRLTRFRWWIRRLQRQLSLVDLLRLDHFRALESAWCVPGGDHTAERGIWRPSPGASLLRRLSRRYRGRHLPLIAEDLGVITPAVEALRDRYGLPGMKILQFAFDGDPHNPYLPANYRGHNWCVYTGTHDNATCIGWWQQLSDDQRHQVEQLLGPVQAPGWQLLELAMASEADWAVVPLQDLLHLGDEARFNTPGTSSGNWLWRLSGSVDQITGPLKGFGELAQRHQR
ncbi:4-alpha-glucanotransferase [Synechococcus sp. CB0101]|uniref:4-alpha-glucanotransferase n=1 Tax=Synechococcus sp. CB0101 TaxID=232348 RepID=UPI0002001928|nr:4-alpha-glucanotransferase [Synechococcus sp. CB0101]QCH15681.1 4-alpha-glucanotransferase [Synechococcus sp. CB0101]